MTTGISLLQGNLLFSNCVYVRLCWSVHCLFHHFVNITPTGKIKWFLKEVIITYQVVE